MSTSTDAETVPSFPVVVEAARPTCLSRLERARLELAEAKTIDDVLSIRSKAEAVRVYARQIKETLEIQNACAELKIRAERRAGEMLKEMTEKGERAEQGGDRKSKLQPATLKLGDMGIEKTQAHRWQRIATLPTAEFEAEISATVDSNRELTTDRILKAAKQHIAQQATPVRTETADSSSSIVTSLDSLRGRKFSCIYADPPWAYGNQGSRGATDNHYPTMSVEEICKLPVGATAADNSHFWLWTTNSFLREAFEVMAAWGFEYKSSFVWVKPHLGMGNYLRNAHEHLLFGVRGSLPFGTANERSWQEADRLKHSEKPAQFRAMVERNSPGPYLEMFGRQQVPGWTVFGNQVANPNVSVRAKQARHQEADCPAAVIF